MGEEGDGAGDPFEASVSLPNSPAQVLDATEELALPQTPRYEDVFNDTSIHWFPLAKLRGLPTAVWMSREEPDYRDCEDLEIIRNEARGPEAAPSTP